MYKVVVNAFGGSDQLSIVEEPELTPDSNQVIVRLTSIGMNHADLMARRGEYRLISGAPPFTPGIEGGGYIEAIGDLVTDRHVGQRVILTLDAPASKGIGKGTYQSHYLIAADKTIPAPDEISDEILGAIWYPYLTAWGCLIWRQQLQPGQSVLIPAASSSVAIAASQVVKHYGGIAIGTTTSPDKVEKLQAMPEVRFDHLIVTRNSQWWREVKHLTAGKGPDVIFDPVAAGEFLNQEIRLIANGGTIWIYGLLGKPDVVDVSPLIRKAAAIRGWLINELSGSEREQIAYQHVLECLVNGTYKLPIAAKFSLCDVRHANQAMEKGEHIGKLILIP
ncbi:Zn-dependent oxidoreductase, NADPH:quinone reductase [Pleurocapsa sp. PCC 7327]|uniref:zinc-binding dehydrogenase n=1 Tax=Pleurocapsa sp. PCC 7327 TaxID=118163 RepID=UPI00029FFB83|nr:zinc-binding dehydrogenase [Pleurocapsa sp. PCC 7327]AFY76583.1 Zn-dependent oxidoreductase, NADPH:quinone reductase [Pleurocapsa sp. PCC 7327]